MITIVALGNKGEEYAKTRHNVGWLVMDSYIENHHLPTPVNSAKYQARLSEGVLFEKEIAILYPTTYMNHSGVAVARYSEQHDGAPIVVVHDDVDLPFGSVKISKERGAGGHNGVQSIIDALGNNGCVRIRIGIAPVGFFGQVRRPKGDKLQTFVLGAFRPGELKKLPEIVKRVDIALRLYLENGVEKAMQEINK